MITVDYHIHTCRCGHATGGIQEYIDSALKKGLKEIGFADHAPMYWLPTDQRDPGIAMKESELGSYVDEILEAALNNRGLKVRLGIELDYIPGYEKEAISLLCGHPFDYVIGSVHFIDGWAFDHPDFIDEYNSRNIDEIYRDYFNLLSRAAVSGIYDIMAHPDLVKKFGYRPQGKLTEYYEQAASAFAKGGVCVEVNTAGLRWDSGEAYPSLEFLKICRAQGVPASVGSDAHSPGQVGFGFAEARKLLLAAGYSEIAVFEKRKRKMRSIG